MSDESKARRRAAVRRTVAITVLFAVLVFAWTIIGKAVR